LHFSIAALVASFKSPPLWRLLALQNRYNPHRFEAYRRFVMEIKKMGVSKKLHFNADFSN